MGSSTAFGTEDGTEDKSQIRDWQSSPLESEGVSEWMEGRAYRRWECSFNPLTAIFITVGIFTAAVMEHGQKCIIYIKGKILHDEYPHILGTFSAGVLVVCINYGYRPQLALSW